MSRLDLLAVAGGFADAHVQHDLVELRGHHGVAVAELLDELRLHGLGVERLEPGAVDGGVKHR
jgi:hypothetical protein